MKIDSVIFEHVGPIEHEELRFGHVNVFQGPNGSGKTLRVKAIRSAIGVEKPKEDFSVLLSENATLGSTTVIESNVRIKRQYSLVGSSISAKHRATKEKMGPEANRFIKETFDPEVINAEAFLDKDPKKQMQAILEAIPFELDVEGLRAIIGVSVVPGGHPLEVIDRVIKETYDRRTEINREAKAKLQSAKEIFDTTPAEMELALLDRDIEEVEQYIRQVTQEREEAIEGATIGRDSRLAAAQTESVKAIAANKTKVDSEIEAFREEIRQAERLIAAAERGHANFVEEQRAHYRTLKDTEQTTIDDLRSACDAGLEDTLGESRSRLIALRVRRDTEVSAKAVRTIAADNERDGNRLKVQADELTERLGKLAHFKGNMLQSLPIPGIELRDGQIYIDGKPSDQAPASRLHILTIDLAIARGAEPIIVDGCDTLDDANFQKVIDHLRGADPQSFLARWNDNPTFQLKTFDRITF